MLSLLLITVVSQLTLADGFLNTCQLDRTQRVDDELVVDVLQTFYADLFQVGCIRELGEITPSSEGYTQNHFEHGMSVLKAINAFNIAVDEWYRIERSPNLQLLSEIYSAFKDQVAPLEQVDSLITRTRTRLAPLLSDDRPGRVGQSMAIFGESMPLDQETVDSILCEYGQKLQIMGTSTNEPPPDQAGEQARPTKCAITSLLCRSNEPTPVYSDVLDQLNLLDAKFAKRFNRKVVNHINKDMPRALSNVEKMRGQLENASDFKESFAIWFRIELTRRHDQCDQLSLNMMQRELDIIEIIRRTSAGVSIGRILDLRAKVVFRLMGWFHRTCTRNS